MADLHTAAGTPVPLGRRIGGGGEGAVHELPTQPHLCAKVYHALARTAERRTKLDAMIARPPTDPGAQDNHHSIAWPQALLFEGATPAGFVMPLAPPGAGIALEYLQPEDRLQHHPGFTFQYLLTAGRNLAAAVHAVHQTGCCIGDINESNCLITGRALVTLIDCDSFQVTLPTGRASRCPVGKPEYTAPELASARLATTDRTPATDAFGLAVLLFQLLMQGFHPFAGRWPGPGEPPSVSARIQRGLYAYDGRSTYPPPAAAPAPRLLPPPLRLAFQRAFVQGTTDPTRRPLAEEWVRLLDDAREHLRTCPRNAHHVFARHLRICPWCAAARRGTEYFPMPPGTQVPLPEARGVAVGQPRAQARLQVEPAQLAFTDLVRGGATQTAMLTLRNIGRDVFHGRLMPAGPCDHLSFSPTEFALSPFHGENELRVAVRVHPGSLPWGSRRTTIVRAVGNAPPVALRVAVTTVEDAAAAAAADTFGRIGRYAAPVVAIAAAVGVGAWGWGAAAGLLLWLRSWLLVPAAPLWWGAVAVWALAVGGSAWIWRWRRPERPLLGGVRVVPPAFAVGLPVLGGSVDLYLSGPTHPLLGWCLALLFAPPTLAVAWGLERLGRRWIRGLTFRRGAGPVTAVVVAATIALVAPAVVGGSAVAAHALSPVAPRGTGASGPAGLPTGTRFFTLVGGPHWHLTLLGGAGASTVDASLLPAGQGYAVSNPMVHLSVPGAGSASVDAREDGVPGHPGQAGWRYLVVTVAAGGAVHIRVNGQALLGGQVVRGPAVLVFRRV